MSWELDKRTTQIARKDYHCDASDWILNAGLPDEDFSAEQLASIEKAKQENWKILKGTEYLKVRGKWEGEWTTYRARPDLHQICIDQGFYED